MQESTSEKAALKLLPLDALHRAAGAKMVPFAGYSMPLKYQSVEAEWRAVRERCGLFDVSHMGKLIVQGPTALDMLQQTLTNDVSKLARDRVQYSLMCNGEGGIIDDLTVYRLAPTRFMLIVNGATKDKDLAWLSRFATDTSQILNVSDRYALFALQGPHSSAILSALGLSSVTTQLKYYSFCAAKIDSIPVMIARLGYTGEDGFEIRVEAKDGIAEQVWNALVEPGKKFGLALCGLAARDVLRLEAGMPLYGKDLDETHSPLEAGLDRFVAFQKNDFVGKTALLKEREEGVWRRLVGFSRGIAALTPEQSNIMQPICNNEKTVGVVTSSVISPQYGGIGMAYVTTDTVPGTGVAIYAKKHCVPALITALPFYRRKRTTTKEV